MSSVLEVPTNRQNNELSAAPPTGLTACRAVVAIGYRVFHTRADNHPEVIARPATNHFEFIRAVRDDRKLSSKTRLFLYTLATHGLINAWADLKSETGLSEDGITRAKKEATAQGWVVRTQFGRGAVAKMRDAFDLYIPGPGPQPGVNSAPCGIDRESIPQTDPVNSANLGGSIPHPADTDAFIDTPGDATYATGSSGQDQGPQAPMPAA